MSLINSRRLYVQLISLYVVGVYICGQCISAQNNASARIVGGTTTTISNLPYLVQLRKNGVFFCGGSLVSTQHVITAAHCVKGMQPSSITVVGGATDLSELGVRRSVAKILTPRAYRSSNLHMDVAVLKLTGTMSGRNIERIALCNDVNWKSGDFVQVSGWGQTSEKNGAVSNRVRTIKISLIAKSKCKQQYGLQASLTSTMFCASVLGAQDACSGDSGGPAVYNNQLCGIVSWGIGCARKNYPGVYTNINVKTVKSFIQKAIQM